MAFPPGANFDHMTKEQYSEMSAKGPRNRKGVPMPNSGNPSPETHKWTTEVRDRLRTLVGVYDRRGMTQVKIAQRITEEEGVSISQQQVSVFLAEVRLAYRERMKRTHEEMLEEKLAQYREIRAAAWDAYERSNKDVMKEVEEFAAPLVRDKYTKNGNDKGRGRGRAEESLLRLKLIVTKQGRLPASEYLRMIMDTLQAERDLLGVDAAKRVDVTSDNVNRTLSWVSVKPGERYVPPDDVGEKLRALEAQLPKGTLKPADHDDDSR